jgi:hypothetical protein
MTPAAIGKIQSATCKTEVWKYRLNKGTYTISMMHEIENRNASRRFLFEKKYFPKAFP